MEIFSGIVTRGAGLGKKFGYPTANISIDSAEGVEGVYVAKTRLVNSKNKTLEKFFEHKSQYSIVFIGIPTINNETMFRLETHVLDIQNIEFYDAEIAVELISKVRDNLKFDSKEKLIDQMKLDEKFARVYIERNG